MILSDTFLERCSHPAFPVFGKTNMAVVALAYRPLKAGTVAPRNSGGPCLERHPEASGYAGQRDAGFLRPRIHPLTWVWG